MKKKLPVFSAKDKEIFETLFEIKGFQNKKKKRLFAKDLKKICIDKIISSNLHIAGLERFCVNEMQFFVSVVKQNTCVIDLKFFWFNFIRALRFLQLVSSQKKKVFFFRFTFRYRKTFYGTFKKIR